ncbi:MAG TPA: helix-turn-helix transcriptional regulator [Candidatus Limnocylindria bacterium]|nr:helix-turn-helix transcriptional regulator [Candidatus Limnocylindria bacterium]
MPAPVRLLDHADRGTTRSLRTAGEEFHHRRVELGLSQDAVASAARMSRNHYRAIEGGLAMNVPLGEVSRVAVVLGLSASFRLYPGGPPLRDRAHAGRLRRFANWVRPPLTIQFEVPLPSRGDVLERRAWDAMISGAGVRTAIELEMRLRDIQGMRQRFALTRRDDPTNFFILLVADTRNNRRVVAEYAELLADLPRLRPTAVRALLEAGRHPGTGLLLV